MPQNLNAVRREWRRVKRKYHGETQQRGPTWVFVCRFIVDSFKLVYNGLSTLGIMMDISFIMFIVVRWIYRYLCV